MDSRSAGGRQEVWQLRLWGVIDTHALARNHLASWVTRSVSFKWSHTRTHTDRATVCQFVPFHLFISLDNLGTAIGHLFFSSVLKLCFSPLPFHKDQHKQTKNRHEVGVALIPLHAKLVLCAVLFVLYLFPSEFTLRGIKNAFLNLFLKLLFVCFFRFGREKNGCATLDRQVFAATTRSR